MLDKQHGLQRACREQWVLEWMKRDRPDHFAEYEMGLDYGHYSMWLMYLWQDGDAYSEEGIMKNCVVSLGDRRSYFRTAVQALVSNTPFDAVAEYSEDTTAVYKASGHDGEWKLNMLVSLLPPQKYYYIGGGEQKVFEKTLSTELVVVDPYFGEVGILQTYPIQGANVVSDAYYEGFVVDQERLREAKVYHAKRDPVCATDFVYTLPGMSEARYTNDPRYANFMLNFLADIGSASTRDGAVTKTLRRMFGDTVVARAKPGTMAFREFTDHRVEEKEKVPFEEFALFDDWSLSYDNGLSEVGKVRIVEKYRNKKYTPEFISYVSQLQSKEFLKSQQELYPILQRVDISRIWNSVQPLPSFKAPTRRDVVTRLVTTIDPEYGEAPAELASLASKLWRYCARQNGIAVVGSWASNFIRMLPRKEKMKFSCTEQEADCVVIIQPTDLQEFYKDKRTIVVDFVREWTPNVPVLREAGFLDDVRILAEFRGWRELFHTKEGLGVFDRGVIK